MEFDTAILEGLDGLNLSLGRGKSMRSHSFGLCGFSS
jgi:hypothetical protein